MECGDCEKGTPPHLWPENIDAFDLWEAVSTQWRASGFGLIGLDDIAVQLHADKLGIDFDGSNLKKIRMLESWRLAKIREGRDK